MEADRPDHQEGSFKILIYNAFVVSLQESLWSCYCDYIENRGENVGIHPSR